MGLQGSMSFKVFNTVMFSKNWLSVAVCTAAEASLWHPTDRGFQIFICHLLAEWATPVSLNVGFVRAAVRAGSRAHTGGLQRRSHYYSASLNIKDKQ